MTYRVTIHPDALEDIRRNAQWWADHHSTEQALRWYENALTSLYGLKHLPESNGFSRENDDFPYEIRDLLFGLGSRPSYRAIFTMQGDVVHVLTVQRGAQDSVRSEDIAFDPDA